MSHRARRWTRIATPTCSIVGGGYTGMWTAWHAEAAGARRRGSSCSRPTVCGRGPSGRNGGFCNAMWLSLADDARSAGATGRRSPSPAPREEAVAADRQLLRRARESTPGSRTAATCRSRRPPPTTTPAREAIDGLPRARRAGQRSRQVERRRGRGALRLARLPRRRVLPGRRDRPAGPAGARAAPRGCSRPASRSTSPRRCAAWDAADGVEATDRTGGRVRARAAMLAIGGRRKARRGPLRGRLTVASCHMVITEPVPDAARGARLDRRRGITDSRALVHYFRTTPDGRIAFGWGGGRIVLGAHLRGRAEVDRDGDRRRPRSPARLLPRPRRARASPTPGAGRSTPRRPICRWSCRCRRRAPSPPPATPATASARRNMVGRTLASLALDRRDDASPPRLRRPLAAARPPRALPLDRRRSDPSRDHGQGGGRARRSPARRLSSRVAEVPELIGFHIGR